MYCDDWIYILDKYCYSVHSLPSLYILLLCFSGKLLQLLYEMYSLCSSRIYSWDFGGYQLIEIFVRLSAFKCWKLFCIVIILSNVLKGSYFGDISYMVSSLEHMCQGFGETCTMIYHTVDGLQISGLEWQ